ncbi:MAG: DUF1007 family protein [Thiothrix sp.]|uniref:DUF1007 family protein n=1 Tax=Thiothrix sp. TaxID=1032 RepID=UPI002638E2FA|nr:DUF1007 family protein [Thiothrix sp.]MDD5392536.1 DUF1007 family protein [Thiothrix sp.]
MNKFVLSGVFALTALCSAPSFAHDFHHQISVDTALKTNAQGELVGLQMHWLNDENVSKAMLEDEDMSPEHREQTLQQIGGRLLHDLRPMGYYTQLKLDGQTIQPAEAKEYTLTVTADQRLMLDFLLPLPAATAMQGKTLTWNMLDPEGSGILRYADSSHLSLGENPPAHCQLTLSAATAAADATPEEQSKASQTVSLTCPS